MGHPTVNGDDHDPTRPIPPPPGRGEGETRLRRALRRTRPPAPSPLPPLNPSPTNPFELAIAERIKAMQDQIDLMRAKIDWLLLFIVAAAMTNVVISMLK